MKALAVILLFPIFFGGLANSAHEVSKKIHFEAYQSSYTPIAEATAEFDLSAVVAFTQTIKFNEAAPVVFEHRASHHTTSLPIFLKFRVLRN